MPARQTFPIDDEPKPATLISTLRRSLARQTGCGVNAAVTKMWEVLSCTGFDSLGDVNGDLLGRLVCGEEIGKDNWGLKRIF